MKKVNSTENMGTKGIVSIELSKIVTGDFNPRKSVNENGLTELAESIKQVGILQPVLVRPKGKKFEIVCGTQAKSYFEVLEKYLAIRNVFDLLWNHY